MKKALSLFLTIVLTLGIFCSMPFTELPFSITAEAASSGNCGDNLTWILDDEGTLTISGIGDIPNYSFSSPAPWDSVRSSIKHVVIDDGVTRIGDYSFCNCIYLTTIAIPYSLTSISPNITFGGCGSLTAVNVTSTNRKYTSVDGVLFNKDKSELVLYPQGKTTPSYDIPDSVISIERGAFENCASLSSVMIPDSVTSIGYCAFEDCVSLASVTIPDSVTNIESYAFCGCTSLSSLALPNGIKTISYNAFSRCINLQSVTIPNSVTSIDISAFYGCSSLNSVTIPDRVTTIGSSAFSHCTGLTSVIIPDSVTNIERWAFADCSNIVSLVIGKGLLNIESAAFENCSNLTNVFYSSSETDWGDISIGHSNYALDSAEKHYGSIESITGSCTKKRTVTYTCPDCSKCLLKELNSQGHKFVNNRCCICNIKKSDLIESSHPYPCNFDETYLIEKTGAKSITVFFSDDTELENSYDKIYIYDEDDVLLNSYTGSQLQSEEITVTGDVIKIRFVTDSSATKYGFRITDIIAEFENCDHLQTVTENDVVATCTVNGMTGDVYCAYCDEMIRSNERISALGHNYSSSWTIDTVATCTENGLKSHHCTRCDAKTDVTSIAIDSSNHNYSSSWTIDTVATCTENGSKSHHCTRCDAKTGVTTIVATGHNYGSWFTNYSATCTATGEKYRYCSNCDYIDFGTISALGHSYSTNWTIDTPATCTTKGSKSHHCTRCDAKGDVTVISAKGHDYTSWYTNYSATCTASGEKYRECYDCYKTFYEAIPALGHNYSTYWTIDVAPTCQSTGSKSHHCTRCDKKTDITVVNPTAHQFSDWEILKEATYTSYGQKVSTCDVCHSTEYAVIPKLICSAPKLKKVSNTASGVKVTWSKVTGAESYVILRKTGNGNWKKIAENVTGTAYTDKTAKSGKTYKYTVRTSSQGGLSEYNTAGLTIKYLADPVLKTPTSIKSGITLKWSKVTGAQGYVVYRKTGNGSYKKLATVKGVSKLSYVDKSAKKNKKYTYKLKAYYGKTYSAYSNAKTIKDKY